MSMSPYLHAVRAKLGHDLLLVPSVTGLVFDESGRVLLLRHSEGDVWVAPGGSVDPDESPVDAVVRELWEETGLLTEPVALRGVFGGEEFRVRYRNGDEVGYVMSVYECRVVSGRLRVDGGEALEAGYFDASEFARLDLARWSRVVLPAVLESRDRVYLPPTTWRPPH